MKIYIVRHGQSTANLLKLHGFDNDDLTEVGIIQATQLKEKIANIDYDIVISSPLTRASHTAKIINIKDKEILIDERLKERSRGNLSGQPVGNENNEVYWDYNVNLKYESAENIRVFFKRVFETLDELKTKEYKTVLIVTHKGVSKAFSAYFEGIKDGRFLNSGLSNCEIKEYYL